MPYKIYQDGDGRECVHKLVDGKKADLKHCYSGKRAHAQALAYLRALYAAEGRSKEMEDVDRELGDQKKELFPEMVEGVLDSELKPSQKRQFLFDFTNEILADSILDEISGTESEGVEPPSEATEYTELAEEDYVELFDDPDEWYDAEGKAKRRKRDGSDCKEGDEDCMDEDEYEKAKRSDVSPAERRRAVEEYGNVTYADSTNKKYPIDSEAHIRAAWSYINMPKNASKYPDHGAAIKRKIVAAWKRKIDKKGPPQAAEKKEFAEHLSTNVESIVFTVVEKVKALLGIKPKTMDGFLAYKEVDGSYRWLARYSNNFRDQDNPPEIISSQSHQAFAEKVEKGLAPLPELWIWHVKEWRIGTADWVTYDPDSGFALSGGRSLPGAEPMFEALSNVKGIKVSHGMPKQSIIRDATDESIIVEHETREISPLPEWAAANKLTGFVVLDADTKEAPEMAIPADKRSTLIKEWGISEELLAKIEAANLADSEKAKEEGLESKETPQLAMTVETVGQTVATNTANSDYTVVTTAFIPEGTGQVEPQPNKELAEMKELLASLAGEVKALREKQAADQEALNKAIGQTPAASILSMFGAGAGSAIGAESTQVDGRTSLAKSKPAETKQAVEGKTFVPFINEILAGATKPDQP